MSSQFVDDRPTQKTLVPQKRPEKETRIDRGSSDEFNDDRKILEKSPDPGDQANLTTETVDDGNQKDLTGDIAGDTPQWSE